MKSSVALFGEAEKGTFQKPYFPKSLPELIDDLGQPPKESKGLDFAVQAILYERNIVYFRVGEEGFSKNDYMMGFKEIARKETIGNVDAICLPGVGDAEIIKKVEPLCYLHKSFIILTEQDFYDYLTNPS